MSKQYLFDLTILKIKLESNAEKLLDLLDKFEDYDNIFDITILVGGIRVVLPFSANTYESLIKMIDIEISDLKEAASVD
jgi:hypothetical protein